MSDEQSILVSVVIPAFNRETYIKGAIDSVISQTYTNWEIIVVDDGSTDSTGIIVDEYAKREKKIKVIHTDNYGVSHARNIGINRSKGDWIAFLDSDDIYPINAIENLVNGIGGVCDLVIGNYKSFPDETRRSELDTKIYDMFGADRSIFFETVADSAIALLYTVWGKLYSKKCIKYLFNTEYHNYEDTMFNFQNITEFQKIRTIPEVTYLYRREDMNSLSHNCGKLFYYNDFFREINRLCNNGYFDEDFMYSWYVNEINSYVKSLYWNLNPSEIRMRLQELFGNEQFNSVPLAQYRLKAKEAHKWLILKTKEMKLIEQEFGKNRDEIL